MPARPGSRKYCQRCRKQFTRLQGSNRLNCYDCKPSRAKPANNVIALPSPAASGAPDGGLVERLTRATLAEHGREETWQGAVAIALAKLIDEDHHGASGAAGNVKAHREAMAEALRGAGQKADKVTRLYSNERP